MGKTRINLTVQGDTWELFKAEVGQGNASKEIQRYMEMVIDQGISRDDEELKQQLNRLEKQEKEVEEQLKEKQKKLQQIKQQKRTLKAKQEAEEDKWEKVEATA